MTIPTPENNPPDDFPTQEEFMEALQDPEFMAALIEQNRKILKGDFGEVPPELREAAFQIVSKHDTREKILEMKRKMQEFVALIEQPAGTMRAEDRLAEAQRLANELTDTALELPEPHRTEYMKELAPLWEEVRTLRVKE